MAENASRRDFIGIAFGGVAAVGAGFTLFAMKRTWDPLPSVIAGGFTRVDTTKIADGECLTVEWRGKPVYILKKTSDMAACNERDLVISGASYSVGLQICTHLGCIPSYSSAGKVFKCACHGGEFNACGVQTFGPPPRPFDIPPFKVEGSVIVFGEEGPEYKKMTAKA